MLFRAMLCDADSSFCIFTGFCINGGGGDMIMLFLAMFRDNDS